MEKNRMASCTAKDLQFEESGMMNGNLSSEYLKTINFMEPDSDSSQMGE